jgi:hypothetical protein
LVGAPRDGYGEGVRRGLLSLCLLAGLCGCDAGVHGQHTTTLDNRKLQTDIAILCHDLARGSGTAPGDVHARLQRDANGLIQLLHDPDSLNTRRDTQRSITLALEHLRDCDSAVAKQLEHAVGA